jgi:hypothetical protein
LISVAYVHVLRQLLVILVIGGLYYGGSAFMVEKALGSHGGEILYVGDHIFTDISKSKVNLKWRTTLICRELERQVVKDVLVANVALQKEIDPKDDNYFIKYRLLCCCSCNIIRNLKCY